MKSWERSIGPFTFTANWKIISIVILIAILFLLKVNAYHLPLWDEGDMIRSAGQAINDSWIFLGSGFKPLFVLSLVIPMLLFGVDMTVGLLVTLFFGLLAVYFLYLVVEKVTRSTTIASFSALIFSLTGYFFYYVRIPRPDIMAAFYILFILFFYLNIKDKEAKKWYVVLALLIGVGIWIRTTLVLVAAIIVLQEIINMFYKKQILKKHLFRNALLIVIVIVMYVGTFTAYSLLEPAEDIRKEGGYQASDYNNKTGNEVFELIKQPFKDFNPLFYILALWQLTSPLFTIMLLLSLIFIILTFWKPNTLNILSTSFIFLFALFSFFPHHRYKVFFIAIPFACALVSQFISRIRFNYLKYSLYVVILISLLLVSMPIYSYNAQAHHLAANEAMSLQPTGLLNSNNGIYLYYAMFENDANYYLERSRITSMNTISELEELEELYENGYDVIILDARGYDVGFREVLLSTTPLFEIENDVWKHDPIIAGNYEQVPYLTPKDYLNRQDWITMRPRDDSSYNDIRIYKTSDVLDTWRQLE